MLRVHGPQVVPGSIYEVSAVEKGCEGSEDNFSDPLVITTGKWGDIVSPYGGGSQPDFADIVAIVFRFQEAASAVIIPRADLVPEEPNQAANFADIAADVSAFSGSAYPYAGPQSCP